MALRAWMAATVLGVLAVTLQAARAEPPLPGSLHTFVDPVFRDTVICDTLEQVRRIAAAPVPDDMYAAFYMTANEYGEPMCVATVLTGRVVEVTPIGVMERNGRRYNAWGIQTQLPGGTVVALYLERVIVTNV